MFTIIISEKGGAERKESFDKNEINVGRVQGNDLMLPKGNVSKHHARLLFRDGRFIVTDLKSTNGTYVNGRKISQATIVREGDKIYVGDFVLKLEAAQAVEAGQAGQIGEDSQGATPAARLAPVPRDGVPPPLPTQMAHAPPPPPAAHANAGPTPAVAPRAPAPGHAGPPPQQAADPQSVSHYPLERDPDESEGAPEVRGAPRASTRPPPPQTSARGAGRTTVMGGGERAPQRAQAAVAPAVAPTRPPTAPAIARALPRETPQQAARRLALITLVDRVADVVNLAPLKQSPGVDDALSQQIDRAVREQAKAMRDEGEAPEGIDLELLARDAIRELVGLGPLGVLLEDEETSEIHATRPDYVLATKAGQQLLADPSFTSEDAMARVVARLAAQSGQPIRDGEVVVERRLARGAHLVAVAPPVAGAWVMSVRKRRRVEATLEEIVRGGGMSRAMATFLEACMEARANVLVVGAGAGAVSQTIGALASVASAGERVAVLQDTDEIAIAQAQVIALSLTHRGASGEQAVRAAARLGTDRVIVESLAAGVAAAAIEAIAEGCEGVVAGVGAPSLRHGLARLVAQVAIARVGASVEAVREAVSESFDVAIEASCGSDRRIRVLRIADLGGAEHKGGIAVRDLFVMSGEGAGDAAFSPTGASPRVLADFAARGIRLDGAIFKRR